MINSFRGEHSWLSNMHEIKIEINGLVFKSVENAYQYGKNTNDENWVQKCLNLSPREIKKASKNLDYDRKKFDYNKLSWMKRLLDIKFANDEMCIKLLSTGDENIVEGNMWGDRFWGVDVTIQPNIGENHLGRLLMKIRDEKNSYF